MTKILLSKDYYKIVLDALLLPAKDVDKYYYNIIEEWYIDNPDLFTELKEQLNEWIEWYKKQVHGGKVPVKMEDGTTRWLDRNQTGEVDDEGNLTWHDLEENQILLLPLLSERNKRVNRAFFENHIKIIDVFCAAETTFNGFWEIFTEEYFSHVATVISNKKPELKYTFIKKYIINNQEEKAINDLIKEFHYTEFELWDRKITASPNKLEILNKAITQFKKEQIIHTLKYDGDNTSLGSRLIDARIQYLENLKVKIEQKLNNQIETIQIPRLQTNLTDTQRGLLFDLLVKDKFIPDNTDRDCFIWAFGGKNDKYTSFKTTWLVDAVFLIDLLREIKKDEITLEEMKVRAKSFFVNKKGEKVKIDSYKNKKDHPNYKKLMKILNTVQSLLPQ